MVFLFDVDNTLIDNDRVQVDLRGHLAESYGEAARDRYWAIFENLRAELGYADYLGALERLRVEDMHGVQIGYVPRALLAEIDAAGACRAALVEVRPHGVPWRWYRVALDLIQST